MEDLILIGKLGIGVIGTIVALLCIRSPRTYALSDRAFSRLAIAALILSRAAVFVGLFIVLHQDVHSDVPGFYVPQAEAAMSGKVIYRDFDSAYGPLFPYIVSLPLRVWHSPKAVVLLTILMEFIGVPLWIAAGRRAFAERTVRIATILYVTSAVAIIMNPMNGSNQVWIMTFVGLSLLLLLTGQSALSGLAMAGAVLAVKVLAGLFVPPLCLGARRRWRWAIAFAIPPAIFYAVMAACRINVLLPLQSESQLTSSGNLPFLLRSFGLPGWGAWGLLPIIVLLLALAALFLLTWNRNAARDPQRQVHLITLVMLVFMILSKKSFTNYMAMFLFPLCLTFAAGPIGIGRLLLFGAFTAIAGAEPSFHFRWFYAGELRPFSGQPAPLGASQAKVWSFLLIDCAMIAGYVWLARDAWKLTFGHRKEAV